MNAPFERSRPWIQSRHLLALLFVAGLGGNLALPRQAWAQKGEKTCLDLVPGDAVGFMHVRLGELRKSPWFKVLPADTQREMLEVHLPFFRGEAEEMVVVEPSPRGLLGFGGGRGRRFGDLAPEKFPALPVPKSSVEKPKPAPDSKEVKECGSKEGGKEGEEDFFEPFYILRLAKKFESGKIKGKVAEKKGPYGGTLYELEFGGLLVLPDQLHVVYSFNQGGLANLGKREGELSKVVAQVREKAYVFAMGLAWTEKVRAQLKEEFADPFGFEGEPFLRKLITPFIEMKSGYVTLTAGEQPVARASAVFTNAAAAKKGKLAGEDIIAVIRIVGLGEMEREVFHQRSRALTDERELEVARLEVLLEAAEEALRQAKVVQEKAEITAEATLSLPAADVGTKAAALVKARGEDPSIKAVRLRAINTDNLRNIGIAMHTFHDAYKILPPQAICDKKTGKPLLSWRVAILPYIEQEPLYRQFKLEEPWDSAHNIKLLDQMPATYAAPLGEGKQKGSTFFQVFTGPGAMFELIPNAKTPFGAVGQRLAAIADGTSNTLMVVEGGKAVPWTKPEDIPFSGMEKAPVPPLGGLSKEGFLTVFGDGSIQFIRLPLEPSLYYRLVHRADGHTIPDFRK